MTVPQANWICDWMEIRQCPSPYGYQFLIKVSSYCGRKKIQDDGLAAILQGPLWAKNDPPHSKSWLRAWDHNLLVSSIE